MYVYLIYMKVERLYLLLNVATSQRPYCFGSYQCERLKFQKLPSLEVILLKE